MLSIPYNESPLYIRNLQFIPIFIGSLSATYFLVSSNLKIYIYLIISVVYTLMYAILFWKKNKLICNYMACFITVFSSIALLKLLSEILVDSFCFISFYFSINKLLIYPLLMSAGNSLGDYFGNMALAK